MNRAEIRLKNESLAELDNYLITRGVPMPVGKVEDAAKVKHFSAGRTEVSNGC